MVVPSIQRAFLLSVIMALSSISWADIGFTPGAVYRDFVRTMHQDDFVWRVTNPKTDAPGAQPYVNNPALRLHIQDLQKANKAEAIIDYWGGHPKTTERKFRFNGKKWIDLPYPSTIPGDKPQRHVFQSNPAVGIPLSDLRQGMNTFEGTCGYEVPTYWGQFGWYEMRVRVGYADGKEHPKGRIAFPLSGGEIREDPIIRVEASSAAGVACVEVVAYYDGYNLNGDLIGPGWHCSYVHGHVGPPRIPVGIVGRDTTAPYEIRWNTRAIPDQKPKGIRLVARILDRNGIWYVTPVVENITLSRPDRSVKLYSPHLATIPAPFWVMEGQKKGISISIPTLEGATEAVLLVRTWNGVNHHDGTPLYVGQSLFGKVPGKDHDYAFDKVEVSVKGLRRGPNYVGFSSDAHKEHGCEILWPGPALLVEYDRPIVGIRNPINIQNIPAASFAAYPSVFSKSTKLVFAATGQISSPSGIRIFNAKGDLIRQLNGPVLMPEKLVFWWDGMDGQQRPVSNGWYYAQFRDGGGYRVHTTRVLAIE